MHELFDFLRLVLEAFGVICLFVIAVSLQQGARIMSVLQDQVKELTDEVAVIRTVAESENALLSKIFGLLQAAVDTGSIDNVKAAVAALKSEQASMEAAIAANTPTEPPPAP